MVEEEVFEKNFAIKYSLKDLKTGKEIDWFEHYEETEEYAKEKFENVYSLAMNL